MITIQYDDKKYKSDMTRSDMIRRQKVQIQYDMIQYVTMRWQKVQVLYDTIQRPLSEKLNKVDVVKVEFTTQT